AVIDVKSWEALKARAAKRGLTPSGTLMAAFTRILARWGQSPHFTLNVTLFQRAPLHPHVNRLVGDFTSILLLEAHDPAKQPFEALASQMAAQFWSDLEHQAYGGLQVLQELSK